MKVFLIQTVTRDGHGFIRTIKTLGNTFLSKDSAQMHGMDLCDEFYVLEMDCVKTYDGRTGKDME